jgi:hypothetical protein
MYAVAQQKEILEPNSNSIYAQHAGNEIQRMLSQRGNDFDAAQPKRK